MHSGISRSKSFRSMFLIFINSWSTSGRLLASGSDDQHLNVHAYQRDSSNKPFSLTTTVATGHTANIFSVKFMPHSNDQTLVTAAGDAEVRVFDIEYSGRAAETSPFAHVASSMRTQRLQNTYKGVKYLTDGNTNSRVYRSHADRVKRIVTESSPYLFLTCSEDGEVRSIEAFANVWSNISTGTSVRSSVAFLSISSSSRREGLRLSQTRS